MYALSFHLYDHQNPMFVPTNIHHDLIPAWPYPCEPKKLSTASSSVIDSSLPKRIPQPSGWYVPFLLRNNITLAALIISA